MQEILRGVDRNRMVCHESRRVSTNSLVGERLGREGEAQGGRRSCGAASEGGRCLVGAARQEPRPPGASPSRSLALLVGVHHRLRGRTPHADIWLRFRLDRNRRPDKLISSNGSQAIEYHGEHHAAQQVMVRIGSSGDRHMGCAGLVSPWSWDDRTDIGGTCGRTGASAAGGLAGCGLAGCGDRAG